MYLILATSRKLPSNTIAWKKKSLFWMRKQNLIRAVWASILWYLWLLRNLNVKIIPPLAKFSVFYRKSFTTDISIQNVVSHSLNETGKIQPLIKMKQVPLRNSEIQILDRKWQRPTHFNYPENGDIPIREFIFDFRKNP